MQVAETELSNPEPLRTTKPWIHRINWIFPPRLVLLVVGQYRLHHQGTDLIETFTIFGLMSTNALQKETESGPGSGAGRSVRGLVFGSLAVIFFILLVASVARHGLRF